MTNEQLIQQIEDALERLRAGDETAIHTLRELLIQVGNISDSAGIAIGSDIRQTVVQIIYQQQGLRPEYEHLLAQEIDLLEQSVDVPASPKIELPPPSPNPHLRDHIFISYDHADRAFVERLAQDLREKGHTVWIDFEGIRGGDVWRQAIVDGIHASAIVLVMLSPNSVVSDWVRIEVQTALEYEKVLIPVLVRPLDTDKSMKAWKTLGIDHIQYRNFTTGYDAAFTELLQDFPPPDTGIPGHCNVIAARLAAQPWGLDHYIQEQAKMLPVDASPYEDGVVRGEPENLIRRLWKGMHLLVLGEPGVGKTVALERLAWELATNDPRVVPITVKLLMYDGKPLLEWIQLDLASTGKISLLSIDGTRRFLSDRNNKCYFLFDGLNEVQPKYRKTIVTEITRLSVEYAWRPMVITSRVQDDSWRKLRAISRFKETLLVQTIQEEQAYRYLVAHLGAEDGERLWRGLDERIKGLVTTPLLLWLVKEAWREAKERAGSSRHIRVPDNRGELYRNFVARMLRRDDDRGLGTRVPENERLAALQRLARVMHEQQSLTIAYGKARELAEEQTIQALLVNGLLLLVITPEREKVLKFAPHQTIQEHFAARAIHNEILKRTTARGLGKLWQRFDPGVLIYADDPWWAETFIQLAGLSKDPNALARAIAERNPWLAWWCVQEGRQVDKVTRQAIEQQSIALVRSENVSDRAQAADTLGRIQTPRVADPLMELALDTVPEVAFTALAVLRRMGGETLAEAWRGQDYAFPALPLAERSRWVVEISGAANRPDILAQVVQSILPSPFEWCYIPAGQVTLENNAGTFDVRPFLMAKYPITYVQFQVFIDDPQGFHNPAWWEGLSAYASDPGVQRFRFGNRPRENVSWYDAVAFCRWLSSGAGFVIRLPTEWEWQWAAQGPDGLEYPWGNEFDAARCNTSESNIGQTTPVDKYPGGSSPFGVWDMSGNVWEWCLNEYSEPGSVTIDSNSPPVLRGGSWYGSFRLARASVRDWNLPSFRSGDNGFRVCCGRPPSHERP